MFSILIKSPEKFCLPEKTIKREAEKILLKYFPESDNVELSLFFVDKDEIWQMNRRHRNLDEPASILSFSQQEKSQTEVYQAETGQAFVNSPDGVLRLGDLVICREIADIKNLSLKDLLNHGIAGLFSQIPTANNWRARTD